MLRDIINMIIARLGPIDESKLPSVPRIRINPASIRNILIIRLGRLGDAVLSAPCVAALREHFPHANITIMVSSYNRVIYEDNPHIDDIIVYEISGSPRRLRDKLNFFAALKFFIDIRKRHFDFAVALQADSTGYWLAFLSGAKHRVSTFSYHHGISPLTTRFLLSVRIPYEVHKKELDKHPRRIAHEVDYDLSMISPFGIQSISKELVLVLPQADRQYAEDLLQRHGFALESLSICIHLNHRWFIDGWDRENLYQLINRLPRDIPKAHVIVTSGPYERIISQEFKHDADAVFTDKTMTVKQWAAIIDRCKLVITPDTGATHIASAMKTPIVLVLEQKHFRYFSQRWCPWKVPNIIVKKQFSETEIAEDEIIKEKKRATITDIISAAKQLLEVEK